MKRVCIRERAVKMKSAAELQRFLIAMSKAVFQEGDLDIELFMKE